MTFFVPALKDISERSHPWGLPLQRAEIALHKGYLFPIEREDNSLQTIWKNGFNQCENILRGR